MTAIRRTRRFLFGCETGIWLEGEQFRNRYEYHRIVDRDVGHDHGDRIRTGVHAACRQWIGCDKPIPDVLINGEWLKGDSMLSPVILWRWLVREPGLRQGVMRYRCVQGRRDRVVTRWE